MKDRNLPSFLRDVTVAPLLQLPQGAEDLRAGGAGSSGGGAGRI